MIRFTFQVAGQNRCMEEVNYLGSSVVLLVIGTGCIFPRLREEFFCDIVCAASSFSLEYSYDVSV